MGSSTYIVITIDRLERSHRMKDRMMTIIEKALMYTMIGVVTLTAANFVGGELNVVFSEIACKISKATVCVIPVN